MSGRSSRGKWKKDVRKTFRTIRGCCLAFVGQRRIWCGAIIPANYFLLISSLNLYDNYCNCWQLSGFSAWRKCHWPPTQPLATFIPPQTNVILLISTKRSFIPHSNDTWSSVAIIDSFAHVTRQSIINCTWKWSFSRKIWSNRSICNAWRFQWSFAFNLLLLINLKIVTIRLNFSHVFSSIWILCTTK